MAARTIHLLLGAALLTASATVQAQGIRGVVRDDAGRPLRGAELFAGEAPVRARTDSLGRFALPRIQPGRTSLRVRMITYRVIDTVVVVPANGWAEVNIVMGSATPMLAEVRARGMQNECDPNTLEGFECRRQAGVGYYRGAAELKEMNGQMFSSLFFGFPGIRPRMMRSRQFGDNWRPGVRPSRCLAELVNGRPPFRPIEAHSPSDVISVEYYDAYDKVPREFRRQMADSLGLCDVVVYWLYNARQRETQLSVAEQLAAMDTWWSNDLYDAIVQLLRRSPAKGETRFVPAGRRIAVDFTGLDTAITTLGLDRSTSLAPIERRYPDMQFKSEREASQCAAEIPDEQCHLPQGLSAVRFDTPQSAVREKLSFRMMVSERVESRDNHGVVRAIYEMALERKVGAWVLTRVHRWETP